MSKDSFYLETVAELYIRLFRFIAFVCLFVLHNTVFTLCQHQRLTTVLVGWLLTIDGHGVGPDSQQLGSPCVCCIRAATSTSGAAGEAVVMEGVGVCVCVAGGHWPVRQHLTSNGITAVEVR